MKNEPKTNDKGNCIYSKDPNGCEKWYKYDANGICIGYIDSYNEE